MPALRIFEGDAPDPQREPGEGMLFDRLPIPARRDPRLSDGAKVQLAAIVPKGGPWPDWVERSDEWLREETGQGRTAIHRHFQELEVAGWLKRSTRRNRRKIYLLFDLAGNKRSPCMQSPISVHAIPENGTCTPRFRDMHSPKTGRPSLKGREIKILRSEGGSPSPTSPKEGGSTTTTPTAPEAQTQAEIIVDDPATWDEATAREWQKIAADPVQPFRGLAAKRLAEYHRTHEQGRDGER
jgi:hypothetical protein